jgi:porin
MLSENIYSIGTIADANGDFSDIEWFPGGAEFYKYVELGWVPSRKERYTRNIHIGFFHIDDRKDAGLEKSYGTVISGNWLIGDNWLPFFRVGMADGDGAVVDTSVSIGTLYKPGIYNDLIGFGVGWVGPTSPASRDQTNAEIFYRLSVSRDIAITLSAQSLFNPANNPNEDQITIFGVRTRIAF